MRFRLVGRNDKPVSPENLVTFGGVVKEALYTLNFPLTLFLLSGRIIVLIFIL